jgi:hypothetical protein
MNSEPRDPCIVAAYVQVSGTKEKWNPKDYLQLSQNKDPNKLKKGNSWSLSTWKQFTSRNV